MLKQLMIGVGAATVLAIGLTAGMSNAATLRDNKAINDGLRSVAVAILIHENCPSISARLFKGMRYLKALESHALGLGFSQDEVDAFVDSRPDKDRLEREAKALVVEKGATPGDGASYCTVGEAEIAAKSQIGVLLRSK